MSARDRQRQASAIVFMDLMLGDDTPERDQRRARWERRKGKRVSRAG